VVLSDIRKSVKPAETWMVILQNNKVFLGMQFVMYIRVCWWPPAYVGGEVLERQHGFGDGIVGGLLVL
jgi:hypothetical protein